MVAFWSLCVFAIVALPGRVNAETSDESLETARMFADALSSPARLTAKQPQVADAPSAAPKQLRINTVVTFDPGTARVYSAGRERIAELARSWQKQSAWTTITVEGYSGASGVGLGQIRADRVRGYLIRYGVEPEYVVAVGRGSAKGAVSRVDLAIALCDDATAPCRADP